MDPLQEICQKDGRYKEVIRESPLVKNAVILLGGRNSDSSKTDGRDGREERGDTDRREEKGGNEMGWGEMRVGEKIALIELLNELVQGGMELREEEEDLTEVWMELEEEGNQHVEAEIDEEGEEEKGEGNETHRRRKSRRKRRRNGKN